MVIINPMGMTAKRPTPLGIIVSIIFLLASAGVIFYVTTVLQNKDSSQDTRSSASGSPTAYNSATVDHFGVNYVYHGLADYAREKGGSKNKYAKEYIDLQNEKLIDLGAGWVRSAGKSDVTGFNWMTVEPTEGTFSFTLADIRVQEAQKYSLSLVGTIEIQPDTAVPTYAEIEGSYFDDSKYLVYLNKVVERYDGDGKQDMAGLTIPITYWEIGNEIPLSQMFSGTAEDYGHVLEISYDAIKANCPSCKVLLAGWVSGKNSTSQFNEAISYLRTSLENGGAGHFDIMNYHSYADNCDYSTYRHTSGFRDLLDEYLITAPIWITESNTKLYKERSGGIIEHTIEEQAQDLVKRIVIAFDSGVDVYFWHGFDDVEDGPGVGFYDINEEPKPIFYNYQFLSQKLSRFSDVERISIGSNSRYIYKFTLSTGKLYVLWAEGGDTTVNLSTALGSGNVILNYAVTEMGQTQQETVTVPTSAVPLKKTPAFILP